MSNLIPINEVQLMAHTIAKSGLFGVKDELQAMALMLVAQSEGLHPAVAARDYNIIQNRPAKKSEAMLRDFINSGGKVEWHELSDDLADATFSHPAGGKVRISWDMNRARRAGLTNKDNWKKWPRNMLRARCLSEGVRTVCPSATSGMYSPEEVTDIVDITPTPEAKPESKYANNKAAPKSEDETVIEGEVLPKEEAPAQEKPQGEVKAITEAMARSIRSALSKSGVEEIALTEAFGVELVEQIAITEVNKAIKFATKGSLQ